MLSLALHTGLRVSELIGLKCADVELIPPAQVLCTGKGRKERTTPLAKSCAVVVNEWINECAGKPEDPLFVSARGSGLSADAVQRLVAKYAELAKAQCSSIAKKKVTPHSLRHTCAMNLLQSGVDTSVIALWLGHEHVQTTQIYLHADIELKERALDKTTPHSSKRGRYKPSDTLLAFLEHL